MMTEMQPEEGPRELSMVERIRNYAPLRAFRVLKRMKKSLEAMIGEIPNAVGLDTKKSLAASLQSYTDMLDSYDDSAYLGRNEDWEAKLGVHGQDLLMLADSVQRTAIAQEGAVNRYVEKFKLKIDELNAKASELKEAKERYLSAARENQELLEEMMTDKVSGARSRRYFFKRLTEDLLPFSEKHNTPLSVIAIDLNRFKKANDTYGHQAGDAVLKQFTQLAHDIFPRPNIVARPGGDEFMIAAPQYNEQEAYEKTEILREKVDNHQFTYSEIVTEDDKKYEVTYGIHITFAAGVRQHEKGISVDDLCKGADRAFYAAHMEKNKTVKYSDFIRQDRGSERETTVRPVKNIISRRQVE